jgi:hypothetical protein
MEDLEKAAKRKLIEHVCNTYPNYTVLQIAKWAEMKPFGIAAKHLEHYLNGKGVSVKVNLSKLLDEDCGVANFIAKTILSDMNRKLINGVVRVPQAAYTIREWQLAIGSMDIQWTTTVHKTIILSLENTYRWHPELPRFTQCVHIAAESLKITHNAQDYLLIGQIEVKTPDWFLYMSKKGVY